MPRPAGNAKRFQDTLAEYKAKYNVESLDSPNDVANLHAMIRNGILIEQLQARLDELVTDPDGINPQEIKRVLDSIVALSETNINYEKTLGIDRKTRKNEASESVADYLTTLKARAKEWLDNENRLTKVFCTKCQIMVGRVSGVYDTTHYEASFQCPQCKKHIVVRREEKDVFFDVKDADWRRKYPIDIEQPKRTKAPSAVKDIGADLTIGEDEAYTGDTMDLGELDGA